MRFLVILKTKKYYVADRHYTSTNLSPYETFELVSGGDVIIPRENIEVIERYTDATMDEFRNRHKGLRNDDRYEDGTLLH